MNGNGSVVLLAIESGKDGNQKRLPWLELVAKVVSLPFRYDQYQQLEPICHFENQ
jgi:hypothetical protein